MTDAGCPHVCVGGGVAVIAHGAQCYNRAQFLDAAIECMDVSTRSRGVHVCGVFFFWGGAGVMVLTEVARRIGARLLQGKWLQLVRHAGKHVVETGPVSPYPLNFRGKDLPPIFIRAGASYLGALKGTELRWQREREPKTQIFAENRRFLQIHPFSWKFKHLESADIRRKPKIFAENRRKPQIGLRHLSCVTLSSALS